MTKISKMMSNVKKVFSLVLSFLMILGAITSDMSIVNAWSETIGDAFSKTLSLKIEKSQLNIGEIVKITGIANLPEDAKITSWEWSSSNEDVATVSGTASEANVTAKALGKAKITAVVNYQEKVENSIDNKESNKQSTNAELEIEVVDPSQTNVEEKDESSNSNSNNSTTVVKANKDTEDVKTTDDTSYDPQTEQYIREHINKKYAKADKMELANGLMVKQTLADASKLSKDETIDSLMHKKEKTVAESIYTMMIGTVALYDTDSTSKYYVGYANTMQNDKTAKVLDSCFALVNTNGDVVEDAHFDKTTGLAYVPKSAMQAGEGKEYFVNVQVQLLQSISKKISKTKSNVEYSKTDDDENTKTGEKNISALDLQTKVQTEKGLSKEEMTVSVNGIPLENDGYSYNEKTGNVTINQSSCVIQSISVDINEKSTASKITDKILGIQEAQAYNSLGEMESSGTVTLPDNVKEGDVNYFAMNVLYGDKIYNSITYNSHAHGFLQGDGTKGIDLANRIINGGKMFVDNKTLIGDEVLGDGKTPRDVNMAVDLSGLSSWEYKGVDQRGNWALLRCCHVSSASEGVVGTDDRDEGVRNVYVRVLNLEDNQMLIGLMTPIAHKQTGCSFIKLNVEPKAGNLPVQAEPEAAGLSIPENQDPEL